MSDNPATMPLDDLVTELVEWGVITSEAAEQEWGLVGEVMMQMYFLRWRLSLETVDGPGNRWRCTIYSSITPNWQVEAVRGDPPTAVCEAAVRAERAHHGIE